MTVATVSTATAWNRSSLRQAQTLPTMQNTPAPQNTIPIVMTERSVCRVQIPMPLTHLNFKAVTVTHLAVWSLAVYDTGRGSC